MRQRAVVTRSRVGMGNMIRSLAEPEALPLESIQYTCAGAQALDDSFELEEEQLSERDPPERWL